MVTGGDKGRPVQIILRVTEAKEFANWLTRALGRGGPPLPWNLEAALKATLEREGGGLAGWSEERTHDEGQKLPTVAGSFSGAG